MRLSKLAGIISGAEIVENNQISAVDINVFSLSFDSREVRAGDLFFCLTGGQFDGHEFAESAVKKGAVAVVCERKLNVDVPQIILPNVRLALAKMSAYFYGNPQEKIKVIGVTGTNGKTTTVHLLSSILKAAGKKVGTIGTLGVFYGRKIIAPDLTTPDPVFLYSVLADMVACGIEYVVMEVSAHALHYYKDAALVYSACIFTNLSQDHLDFFKTMERYGAEKKGLFLCERTPLAIVNGDDELGREIVSLRANLPNAKTVSYGLDTPTDAFAVLLEERIYASEFIVNIFDKLGRVSCPLTGRHNVYNALAAATCAYELGVEISAIVAGIKSVKSVKGRLERVCKHQGADIFVDFAHTPDGLEKSLAALKEHCSGRLICVFGCGGNRDKEKRPLMGEKAAKIADYCIITSDNPRYEDPMDIIRKIEEGYRQVSNKYVVVPDRESAIERAIELVKNGDVLLVAGKGGETYQEIMGIKYVFNDNAIIKKIIARIGGSAR